MEPLYLGDGVYVQPNPHDAVSLILTTGSHNLRRAEHAIYMELSALEALHAYVERWKKS